MRTPITVDGVEGVRTLAGQDLGTSDWTEITQEVVDSFADATGDHRGSSVDPERERKDSPSGGPVAHGFLTLSLTPRFLPQLLDVTGFTLGVNYGTEEVRFAAPVPVGSRLRAGAVVDEVTDITGGVQMRITVTFEVEVEGGAEPACVATILLRQYV